MTMLKIHPKLRVQIVRVRVVFYLSEKHRDTHESESHDVDHIEHDTNVRTSRRLPVHAEVWQLHERDASVAAATCGSEVRTAHGTTVSWMWSVPQRQEHV